MRFNLSLACGIMTAFLLAALMTAPAAHGARPVWWEQAQAQAQKAGYGLISLAGLQSLLDRKASFILLDVRTPQEFQQGHLPGALNLQFDFGDQAGLTAAKKKALEAITGGDLERSLVIYDRSLQCPRSNIAASLIVAQGYKKVLRMAPGWLGWQKLHQAGPAAHPEPIRPGGVFPSHDFAVLPGGDDRAYLGLEAKQKICSLNAVKARYLLVCLFNELCLACEKQLGELNKLHLKQSQAGAHDRSLKILAVAMGSSKRQVVQYRKKHQLAFPVFADPKERLFHDLCDPVLPLIYLLEIKDQNTLVVRGVFDRPGQLAGEIENGVQALMRP